MLKAEDSQPGFSVDHLGIENVIDSSSTPETNPQTAEMRRHIHGLLDKIEKRGLATHETVEQYRKGADNDPSPENLKAYYQWIDQRMQKVNSAFGEIESTLEQAVRSEIMSTTDRERLQKKLTSKSQEDVVGKIDGIRQSLQDEIDQFRKDRELYDRIKTDPRFYNGGIQKKGKEAITVPDLKAFLAMPLKTRRAFLEKVRKVLDQPVVGKKKSSPEELRLKQKYHEKLIAAQKKGILGAASIHQLLEEFMKAEGNDKKKKTEAIEKELEPYRKLWAEIRNTLQGPALEQLEKARESLTLVDLKKEFKKISEAEEARLTNEYQKRLEAAERKKILNSGMRKDLESSFMKGGLLDKKKKLETWDGDTEPHRKLKAQIDSLKNDKARKKAETLFMDPTQGLAEIQKAVDQIIQNEKKEDQVSSRQDKIQTKIVSQIKNKRVKSAIQKVRDETAESDKQTLFGRLRNFFSGKREENVGNFQQSIAQARMNQGAGVKGRKNEITKERNIEGTAVLRSGEKIAKEEMKSEEQKEGSQTTKINPKGTFVETEFKKGADNDRRSRVMNVVITDQQGIKSFNRVEHLNSKADKITISTGKTREDRELNFREMKVLTQALGADLQKSKTDQEEQVKKSGLSSNG